MQLGTFTPRPREEMIGDQLQAKEAIGRPLVTFVREHRTGIKTKFNQDPKEKGYKPDGGDGVIVDVADVNTNEVWIDVLWLNGAIVDNLALYVGQAVPIQLVWTPSQKGGNPFIGVAALEGNQLAQAQQWAATNPTRFDTERAQRQANAASHEQPAVAPVALPTLPQAAPAPVTTAPVAAPAPAALNPNDPAVAALLAQLGAQQTAS